MNTSEIVNSIILVNIRASLRIECGIVGLLRPLFHNVRAFFYFTIYKHLVCLRLFFYDNYNSNTMSNNLLLSIGLRSISILTISFGYE